MIKLYLDWNVMAQTKNGFHSELKHIVFNDERLFIPYSTSHISDIFSSYSVNIEQKEVINQDLNFISEVTKNTFLFNNGKDVIVEFAAPIDYYHQLVEQKELFQDLSINGLLKNIADTSTLELLKPYLMELRGIQFDDVFKDAFENPISAEKMETMFHGLKENPTLEGFFQSFSNMLTALNEDEKYKDLRNIVQGGLGISRDKIFDDKAPYDVIKSRYKQLGNEHIQQEVADKNAPKWFNEITNEYILLDMHGYQEDKVNISKGRKQTFKNTIEDAFHAAFASTCNFYIVNDKRAYKKTKQVYEKLRLNTQVFLPTEFVQYYHSYLKFNDPSLNITIPFEILKTEEYYEEEFEDALLRTYYFPFFIFGFFTKLRLLIKTKEFVLLLSRDKPTNGSTYIMEITRLEKEISNLLGQDIDKIGEVKEDEFNQSIWEGRRWKVSNTTYRLVSPNGHFQLYIDLDYTANDGFTNYSNIHQVFSFLISISRRARKLLQKLIKPFSKKVLY